MTDQNTGGEEERHLGSRLRQMLWIETQTVGTFFDPKGDDAEHLLNEIPQEGLDEVIFEETEGEKE